jgi:hypothetical protein
MKQLTMTKRNSPNDIQDLDDLTRIDEIVVDKRNAKRSVAKKGRRDRHYKNQLIKHSVQSLLADLQSGLIEK